MLQFFENDLACHVVLNSPLKKQDIDDLIYLFQRDYISWKVEFGHIYAVNEKIVNLLYHEIYVNQKSVYIITHKIRLNRYFHKLGFKASFSSLTKDNMRNDSDIKIILIGGSANSSEKILEIVKKVSLDNITLVIVQHVEPNKDGIFDKILTKYTKVKVSYAKNGEKIEKNHIYLSPNNKHLKVENACFILGNGEKYNYSRPSISISYESFSKYYGNSLLIIQECGYASDGVDKLKYLSNNGSKIILQDADECEAKSMITNALMLNIQDYTFNLKNIILFINYINKLEDDSNWIEYLLDMINIRYSYDFTLYNRDMIIRRVESFKITYGLKSLKNMVGIILFNKTAFKAFFLEISINVTELFRNPSSFKHIKELLNNSYKNAHNIKLWSAGCSNGKEPYSIAILLQSLGILDKSIIYATDFNSVVLEEAKSGIYTIKDYEIACKNLISVGLNDNLDNYVMKNDKFIIISDYIKNKTHFFEHNLIRDGSFNEFDIIICKNVIIYFNYDLQKIVFELFYNSLKFGGYLILGKSESIHPLFIDKFERCLDGCRIFRKIG